MKMILICLSLLMITGCSLVTKEDKITKEYEGLCKENHSMRKGVVNLKEDMVQYRSKEGNASYIFESENYKVEESLFPLYTLPNKYHVIIDESYNAWGMCDTSFFSDNYNTKYNYYVDTDVFILTIVDVETLEVVNEIDVLEILNANFKDYQFDTEQRFSRVIVRDGKYYHPVPLLKRPTEIVTGKKMDVSVLLVDIETGDFKLSETPYEDYILINLKFSRMKPYRILLGLGDDPGYYLGAANGIPMDVIYPLVWQGTELENVITIEAEAAKLPENNNRLYTLFPELKAVRNEYINIEGGKTMYFQLDSREFPTWQDVLKLFMEDGQEISFEKWDYESEEDYYSRRTFWDYETALTKFKEEMKAQGFEEPTSK